MSWLNSITAVVAKTLVKVLPYGITVHPSFKLTKVADGQFDISWSVAGAGVTGTNHASLVIADGKFSVSGDLAVIGTDSVFPFNVLAQVVNSALQGAIVSGVLKAPRKSTKLLPSVSSDLISGVVNGPVGGVVVVPAITTVEDDQVV
jgi:hypothetical protein